MKTLVKTILSLLLCVAFTSCIITLPASSEKAEKSTESKAGPVQRPTESTRPTTNIQRPTESTRPTTNIQRPTELQRPSEKKAESTSSPGRLTAPAGKNSYDTSTEKKEEPIPSRNVRRGR